MAAVVPEGAETLVTPKLEKPDDAAAEPEVDAVVVAEDAAEPNAGKFKANPGPLVLAEAAAEVTDVAAGVEALVVVVTVENNGEEVVPKLGFEAGVDENAGADADV